VGSAVGENEGRDVGDGVVFPGKYVGSKVGDDDGSVDGLNVG